MTLVLLLTLLLLVPAAVATISQKSLSHRGAPAPIFSVGTPVVYQHDEITNCPRPDAHDLRPSARGEYYYYCILDYLRVIEVLKDGRIIAISRNHQRLCFWPDDSSFRKASLVERFLHPLRFPIP